MNEDSTMKAITLHQPWAMMVAIGAKTYETRSWSTKHRGAIAIHAAKTREHDKLAYTYPFYDALCAGGLSPKWLPYGKIIAICNLTYVVQVPPQGMVKLSDQEYQLGDFSGGRYAWGLIGVERLQIPIPARGQQRIWTWDFGDRPPHEQLFFRKLRDWRFKPHGKIRL